MGGRDDVFHGIMSLATKAGEFIDYAKTLLIDE
jgi:hypothetical protein